MKIVKKIHLKIVIFTAVKNCSIYCILHGHVFVMINSTYTAGIVLSFLHSLQCQARHYEIQTMVDKTT